MIQMRTLLLIVPKINLVDSRNRECGEKLERRDREVGRELIDKSQERRESKKIKVIAYRGSNSSERDRG